MFRKKKEKKKEGAFLEAISISQTLKILNGLVFFCLFVFNQNRELPGVIAVPSPFSLTIRVYVLLTLFICLLFLFGYAGSSRLHAGFL